MSELVNNSRVDPLTLSQRDLDRFWAKVNKTPGCWLWTGAKSEQGYGLFRLPKRKLRANRVSFEIHHGPLNGKWALHRCDNPSCVRPDHLFAGDAIDNRQDAIKKGRIRYRYGRRKINV